MTDARISARQRSQCCRVAFIFAIIGARQQNKQDFPLYGCYVLEKQQYAVSDALVATQDDIYRIHSILQEVSARVTDEG